MNGKSFRKLLLIALGSSALAGCASLDGAPQPIIPVSKSIAMADKHGIEIALYKFHADDNARGKLNQRQYRDMVIAIYLNAIDARYQEFRRLISGEGRGGAIGADLGIIGLSTAATLIEKSASDLSAVSAALAGGKGSVDKALYFDRALPAIMAAMDKERAKVRTHIVSNMRNDENNYTLEVAFGDLAAYEAAASIDRAIESITADATAGRQIETVKLENVIKTCAKPQDLRAGHASITDLAYGFVTNKNLPAIKALATMIGADATGADEEAIETAIGNRIRQQPCTTAELTSLVASIQKTDWGKGIK